MTFLPTDETKRFWSKVDRSAGPEACWPWLGYRHKNGYGEFRMRNKRRIGAHRFAIGLIEAGDCKNAVAMHSCDNPSCCNPKHISLGTQAQNQAEKVQRGRSLTGARNPMATMSEATALTIKRRRKAGERYADIARDLDLSLGRVHKVVNYGWKHLDE
jgi:hypothetical protein